MANGSGPQGPTNTHLAWYQQNIEGSCATPAEALARLRLAAQHCHMIGGNAVCPPLQEGCELMIQLVWIDKDRTYPIKGSDKVRGIGKATLTGIAAAVGVKWVKIKRLDDQRDPRYCVVEVTGEYRDIDGTMRPLHDIRDSNFRDGSDQLAELSAGQIPGARANILRNTVTKAKLRAIRDGLSIDQAMPLAALEKPFAVARVVFTGRSRDPVLRRLFAEAIVRAHFGASSMLYGPAAPPPAAGHFAPGPSAGPGYDADGVILEDDGDDYAETSSDDGATASVAAAAPPPPPPAPPAPPPASMGAGTGPVFKYGKLKGTPFNMGSDRDLAWYAEGVEKSVANPEKQQWRSLNERELAEVRAEQARRRGTGMPAGVGATRDMFAPDDDFPT